MSTSDDYQDDMRIHRIFDEQATEALLAGRTPAGHDDLADLAQLLDGVRWAATGTPPPRPSAELARVFATGLEQTREPAEVASLSAFKRGRLMIAELLTALVAKLAALGVAAKAAVALTATAGLVAGATAVGFVPDDVLGFIGGGGQDDTVEAADVEPAVETGEVADEPASETAEVADSDRGVPADGEYEPGDGWQFGLEVARHNAAEQARIPDEPGSETGEANRPADVPTGRDDAPAQQPEGTPTGADDAPAQQPEETPTGQPEEIPTGADDAPAQQPEGAGAPEEVPTGQPESTPGDAFRP